MDHTASKIPNTTIIGLHVESLITATVNVFYTVSLHGDSVAAVCDSLVPPTALGSLDLGWWGLALRLAFP